MDRIKPSDILVDIGCGKGRVINWWLQHGYRKRIVGIELDDQIAAETCKRLNRHKNVTTIAGDAIQNIPADGTLSYLYNPFTTRTISAFKNRLMGISDKPDNIMILYYNCKHVDVFQNDPAWTVEIIDVGGSSILPFDQFAAIKVRQ